MIRTITAGIGTVWLLAVVLASVSQAQEEGGIAINISPERTEPGMGVAFDVQGEDPPASEGPTLGPCIHGCPNSRRMPVSSHLFHSLGCCEGQPHPPCCGSQWICSTCDMPPHYAYYPPLHGYYYFRPYNHAHIPQQQQLVEYWGGDPRNPYANEVFKRVYAEYEAAREDGDGSP